MASVVDTASSWLNYLTAPGPGTAVDLPAPDKLVLVAVLDDGRTANLGPALYYPTSGVYRMIEGALEVTESTRGKDGVFVTDTGRYRVMTMFEHSSLRRDEAAAATRAAAAAIAPPPAPKATDAALRASTSLSALTISPAATGCSAHAQMATVVAVGPTHIALSLERIRPLIEIARSNHNHVTIVVLGVANDAEAEAALAVPTPRLFLAGANELETLRGRKTVGPRRVYLREAVLIGLVRGSGTGYAADGSNGVWCLPASPVPLDGSLDGSLAAVEPRADKTMVQWHLALNTQWRDWYTRYEKNIALDERDNALLRAYTSFQTLPVHPPVASLPAKSTTLLASGGGPSFGAVDHSILWREGRKADHLWPSPCERWASTPVTTIAASPYWAVATWCHNTQSALRMPRPTFDLQLTLDDLQYDMWTTLATLALHKRKSGEAAPTRIVQRLKGTLGPVILAGRANDEPMRVSWWTDEEECGTTTILMPEAYVHVVLADYNVKLASGNTRALLCSQGFLCLANADEIPVEFTGVTAGELDGERAAFGPRLWHSPSGGIQGALGELHDAPQPSKGLVVYRSQTDADQLSSE